MKVLHRPYNKCKQLDKMKRSYNHSKQKRYTTNMSEKAFVYPKNIKISLFRYQTHKKNQHSTTKTNKISRVKRFGTLYNKLVSG